MFSVPRTGAKCNLIIQEVGGGPIRAQNKEVIPIRIKSNIKTDSHRSSAKLSIQTKYLNDEPFVVEQEYNVNIYGRT